MNAMSVFNIQKQHSLAQIYPNLRLKRIECDSRGIGWMAHIQWI